MNEESIAGRFYGKNIYIIPDDELDTIMLPESLAKYILELQEDNEKYKKESLEAIFKRN